MLLFFFILDFQNPMCTWNFRHIWVRTGHISNAQYRHVTMGFPTGQCRSSWTPSTLNIENGCKPSYRQPSFIFQNCPGIKETVISMTTTTYITNGGSAVRTSGHLNEPSYMGLCCFRTSLNSYPQIIDFLSRGGPARCLMDYWVVPIPLPSSSQSFTSGTGLAPTFPTSFSKQLSLDRGLSKAMPSKPPRCTSQGGSPKFSAIFKLL